MGRRKELEGTIVQRDAEIAILARKADELNCELEKFRSREAAISGAFTNAQIAADRVIKEAETRRDEIIASAKAELEHASIEAKGIVANARERAGDIEAQARANAGEIIKRAEDFMESYRHSAASLADYIKSTARDAAAHAKRFEEYCSKVDISDAVEFTGEYKGISAIFEEKSEVAMPEEYANPAELMHSIYAIERRDIPDETASHAAQPAPEEAEAEEPAMEPAAEEPPVETAEEAEPERVWTVEEIVEGAAVEKIDGLDDELNAIIDEVLKES